MSYRSIHVPYGGTGKDPYRMEGKIAFLLVLAMVAGIAVYSGIKILVELPASLTDRGVHQFIATEGGPTQRTASGQKTKTVYYYVLYRASVDGLSYKFTDRDGNTRASCEYAVQQKAQVQRRILLFENGSYITVDPSITAENYLSRRKLRAGILLLTGGGYLLGFGACTLRRRQKKQRKYDEKEPWELL